MTSTTEGVGTGLFQAFYEQMFGQGLDLGALTLNYIGGASGAVPNGNPPYTLGDFLSVYPKFFGPPTAFNGSTAYNDPVTGAQITGIESTVGMAIGQLVSGYGVAVGSLITTVTTNAITLSLPVTQSTTAASFTVYQAPFIPMIVVQMYINLARASLMYARWFEAWPLAMALYIAHYVTLWMQTESGPNLTAAQVAVSGLQQGIITSQAAGDVSASTEPVPGFDDWGSMALTQYGVQLAGMAKSVGAGPIWVGSGY